MKTQVIKFISDKGGYFGIIGAISMTTSALISFYLHSLVNPSLNTISLAVSDLGTGPVLSSLIFSIGLLIASFSQIPLYISLINHIRKKLDKVSLIKITTLITILSILGHNILSLIPFERHISLLYYTHGIAAGIHYVAGSIALILYGFIELAYLKASKSLMVISFITGVLYGTLWIGYLLDFLVGIPEEYINHTIQWVGLAGIILWALFHGIFLIKAKKRELDNTKI